MDWGWAVGPGCVLIAGIIALLPLRSREPEVLTDTVRQNASGHFIRLSKGLTHYETAGPKNGPVIVLVHGFSVPYYVWDPTVPALTEAGFRVIRYDLYGRGLSDRPRTVYDRGLFVDQLAELLDALHIGGVVHLAGYSMGGAVVAAFASTYPGKTGKIILIDPFCERRDIGILRVSLLGEYLACGFYVPSMPTDQKKDFYRPEDFPEWDGLFRTQMRFRGFRRAILSTLRNFVDRDPTKDYRFLGTMGRPILLIWGREDRTLPMSGPAKLKAILSPEFLWVEEAGHLPHYEHPEIVNPHLVRFLRDYM